jgi:KilA-N domain
MKRLPTSLLAVQGSAIAVLGRSSEGDGAGDVANNDFISLTDIAKHKEPGRADHVIQNWMRNRNTVEFLGVWERLNNEAFKPLEFEGFKSRAGLNSFVLTPKQWIESTAAIGLLSKAGRYGGTFAHKDIAFEFAA